MKTSHILFLSLTGFILAFTSEVKAEDCVYSVSKSNSWVGSTTNLDGTNVSIPSRKQRQL